MRVRRCQTDQIDHLRRQSHFGHDLRPELLALLRRRQTVIPQQIDHLRERNLLGQLVDVVAVVDQKAVDTVDVAGLRLPGDHTLQPPYGRPVLSISPCHVRLLYLCQSV